MEVLLIGGPLDGKRVEITNDAQCNYIGSQKGDAYVRALPSIFISAEVPRDDMLEVIAQKVSDGYGLAHRVGMALTQLDDAAMYECHPDGAFAVQKAREILD